MGRISRATRRIHRVDVGKLPSSGRPQHSNTVKPCRLSSRVNGNSTIGVLWVGSPLLWNCLRRSVSPNSKLARGAAASPASREPDRSHHPAPPAGNNRDQPGDTCPTLPALCGCSWGVDVRGCGSCVITSGNLFGPPLQARAADGDNGGGHRLRRGAAKPIQLPY